MSTIETNQIVLEKIEYNLWTLLESVFDSISFKTHQKYLNSTKLTDCYDILTVMIRTIEMILDIDRDIPKRVMGDPARLQVCSILLAIFYLLISFFCREFYCTWSIMPSSSRRKERSY